MYEMMFTEKLEEKDRALSNMCKLLLRVENRKVSKIQKIEELKQLRESITSSAELFNSLEDYEIFEYLYNYDDDICEYLDRRIKTVTNEADLLEEKADLIRCSLTTLADEKEELENAKIIAENKHKR